MTFSLVCYRSLVMHLEGGSNINDGNNIKYMFKYIYTSNLYIVTYNLEITNLFLL